MMAARIFTVAVMLALAVTACTSATSQAPPATPVAITDYRMVAGQWQGLVTGLASRRADESDSIKVTIGNDGTYDFGVYRIIGAFEGKGQFVLSNGKLLTQNPTRPSTFTLYERDGRRLLKGEGVSNGSPVTAELRPVR